MGRARLTIAFLGAGLLSAVVGGGQALFRVQALPKGRRAPYTMRAIGPFAWSQHEAQVEDVRGFVPIYDANLQLFEHRREAILAEVGQLQAAYWDFAPPPEELETEDAGVMREMDERRTADVVGLAEAVFDLLAPLYKNGVVADEEFPAREREIRVFEEEGGLEPDPAAADSPPVVGRLIQIKDPTDHVAGGRYRRVAVSRLHRFTELRALAESSVRRYVPGIPAPVREQLIRYILDRLPPNLRYSKTNADRIADRSMVTGQKSILTRSGEVLIRRGQIVDTRAESVLRAALEMQPRVRVMLPVRIALMLAIVLFGSQAMAASSLSLARPRTQGLVWLGYAAFLAGGKVILGLTGLGETVVPLAAIPAVVASFAGPRSAVVVALLGAAIASLGLVFELTTFAVLLSGGITAALLARRDGLGSLLVAEAAVALVQAAIFAACIAIGARSASIDSVFLTVQAALAGLVAVALGRIARMVLRFVYGRGRGRVPQETPEHSPVSA